ncbi:UPF0053 protein YegH [Candidatus Providencia siddallii]|uniref:UPF0053 protein YegH n=1 Tax=Candidatus Providencia siddallii TaxID=1715285 RepID=A0A0M6W9E6_9GAMM|nr:UPF0053 protein YegH [Candidatus Providencia siddallii]
MEWIVDPSNLIGFATLVVLEIVLGIDNLVFIALLADKLPSKMRERARIAGLIPALAMRIILLFSLSWLITFTKPIIILFNHQFSASDLIVLVGGIFLLFKATIELNDRLEYKDNHSNTHRKTSKFWAVVTQIIVLDAIFSIDSLITAVGIVDHIGVMISAITIAMILMILASKTLTNFINNHQIIIILCLSFLLMIGFSLVAEGLGYTIPKGYLYAAIGFSIMIESLNQFAQFNRRKLLRGSRYLRERTAEAVLRILSGRHEHAELDCTSDIISNNQSVFEPQECLMIARVLGMAQRNIESIMTSRHKIDYLDVNKSANDLLQLIDKKPHSRLVVIDEKISDEPIGIVYMFGLVKQQLSGEPLNLRALITQPLIFPEGLSLLKALEQFRKAYTHFAFIVDEFGSVKGIVTLTDVIETIAGNLPVGDEKKDSRYDIKKLEDGGWVANGFMPLEDLILFIPIKLDKMREYETIAGLLMEHLQRIPIVGEQIIINGFKFQPVEVNSNRINKVLIFSKFEEK